MTDKSHLDELGASRDEPLSKQLVATSIAGHRDPATEAADSVTRPKDVVAKALREPANAAERSDRP